MIVFGEPALELPARDLAGFRPTGESQTADLDSLRTELIRAGQLEQAIADSKASPEEKRKSEQWTNRAAQRFYCAYASVNEALPPPVSSWVQPRANAERIAEGLDLEEMVTLKAPEGFEFYSLFPEQFCHAALTWSAQQERAPDGVTVVGIRSIGTSLSALVAATLAAAGWRVARFTVRPSGDPFAREIELPRILSTASQHPVIIVDEGPGLSGSSFKAVADGLVRLGFDGMRVSIFPGHACGPGGAASSEVLSWWERIPRYFAPVGRLRWKGLSLIQTLAGKTSVLLGEGVCEVADLSGGQWRKLLYGNVQEWPAVPFGFERTKYLCRSRRQALLWKFTGFNSYQKYQPTTLPGWTPKPVGALRGFTAFPWIDGQALTVRDHQSVNVTQIERHLVSTSEDPLPVEEHTKGISRLTQMLKVNASEGLRDNFNDRIDQLTADAAAVRGLPSYGDGHLSPHEWIRSSDGSIWKTDTLGHTNDHTIVGRQSILWDIAGAMIEWNLDATEAQSILNNSFQQRLPHKGALSFYLAAYAAFKLGLFSITTSSDPLEQGRLQVARTSYRAKLQRILAAPPERETAGKG